MRRRFNRDMKIPIFRGQVSIITVIIESCTREKIKKIVVNPV